MNSEVSYPIAKLLNKKGVIIPSEKMYNKNGTFNYSKSWCISAPTIAQVVMWLYEKHGIWVACVVWEDAPHFLSKVFVMNDFTKSKNISSFNSPTEAYEAAIEYVLNNLIKKQRL